MSCLRAYLESLRPHRHEYEPLRVGAGDIELERCDCGAVRRVEPPEPDEPETD